MGAFAGAADVDAGGNDTDLFDPRRPAIIFPRAALPPSASDERSGSGSGEGRTTGGGDDFWSAARRGWWRDTAAAAASDDDGNEDEDDAVRISYGTLIETARRTAAALSGLLTEETAAVRQSAEEGCRGRRRRRQQEQRCKPGCEQQQPVIVIAIPEGPYLPLAVLAVHLIQLRHYYYSSSSSAARSCPDPPDAATDAVKASDTSEFDDGTARRQLGQQLEEEEEAGECWEDVPIILPLDPDDSSHRLRRMLGDAEPTLVLCATEGDVDKMEGVLESLLYDADVVEDTCIKDDIKAGDGAREEKKEGREEGRSDEPQRIAEEGKGKEIGNCRVINLPDLVEDALRRRPLASNATDDDGTTRRSRPTENDRSELLELYPWPPKPPKLPSTRHTHNRSSGSSSSSSAPSEWDHCKPPISHVVYTSGTSGQPKGCVSSLPALLSYLHAKNAAHSVTCRSVVYLASALSFDPCFSDILATFYAPPPGGGVGGNDAAAGGDAIGGTADGGVAGATLAIAARTQTQRSLPEVLSLTKATHVLCTPTLWSTVYPAQPEQLKDLQVVALGGERIHRRIRKIWARGRKSRREEESGVRLLATYGTTEGCVYQTCGEVYRDDQDDRHQVYGGDGVTEYHEGKKEERLVPSLGGQDVGRPLPGNVVHILPVAVRNEEEDTSNSSIAGTGANGDGPPALPPPIDSLGWRDDHLSRNRVGDGVVGRVGEIVLSGAQLDGRSGYWKRPDLMAEKFIVSSVTQRRRQENEEKDNEDVEGGEGHPCCCYYRTGDLGYIHPKTGNLHILGRLEGEDGMVKINGVRVELGEVESAVLDDYDDVEPGDNGEQADSGAAAVRLPLIVGCVVVASSANALATSDTDGDDGGDGGTHLTAYVVLSPLCLAELGLATWAGESMTSAPPSLPSLSTTDGGGGADLNSPPPPSSEPNIKGGGQRGLILTPPSPLLTLLRARCALKARRGCAPSAFVVVREVPLTKTGKCDRKSLPKPGDCGVLGLSPSSSSRESDEGGNNSIGSGGSSSSPEGGCAGPSLARHGKSGPMVSAAIASALNLPPNARCALLSATSSFAALGGDSLAATRVVRSLYAAHRGVADSRKLGGEFGTLEGPFGVQHLLRAKTLGEYVEWLDANGVCGGGGDDRVVGELGGGTGEAAAAVVTPRSLDGPDRDDNLDESAGQREQTLLYDALLESTAAGQTTVAISLLGIGADPNGPNLQKARTDRLGKVTDRAQRRRKFRSTPLHIACIRGDALLVKALIERGSRCSVPDAGGGFPLHLACSSTTGGVGGAEDEDERRLECARVLLETAHVPLSTKDANRQTVLHAAARSGHPKLLSYLMDSWRRGGDDGTIHVYPPGIKGGRYDWQDRWFRTPVHWAVLNGHVEALRVLLEKGCSPTPSMPRASKSGRRTSAAIESPLEICNRLYGVAANDDTVRRGGEIERMLREAMELTRCGQEVNGAGA